MTYTENELRQALRLFERLAPELTAELPEGPGRRRRPGIAMPASVAVGVLVVALAAATAVLLRSHHADGPSTSTGQTVTTSFDGLTLGHPVSWREAKVTWGSSPPSIATVPIGFLTNAKIGPECTSDSCGAPVRTLNANQVLVTIGENAAGMPLQAPANTSVAGFPALSQSTSAPEDCPHGTRFEQTVTVAVQWQGSSGTERNFRLSACFAGPDTDPAIDAFQALLATATYVYTASSGTAAIHGTVTISEPASTTGAPTTRYVEGNLLVYDNAAHTGIGNFNSPLNKGTFDVGVGPGTYYIEIRRTNASPCDAGPVVVASNQNVQADITCLPN